MTRHNQKPQNYPSIARADATMKITIDVYDAKKEIWHLESDDKETICPKWMFRAGLEANDAILNNIAILDEKTKDAREALEKRDMKKIELISKTHLAMFAGTNSRGKFKKTVGKASQEMVEYYDQLTKSVQDKINPQSLLQKITMALSLADISFDEIEQEVKEKKAFRRTIPISSYDDIGTLFGQHTSNWLSTVNDVLGIARNVMP
jgi:hypothetical protein